MNKIFHVAIVLIFTNFFSLTLFCAISYGNVDRIYEYGYDLVWESLASAITEGNYDIETLEKESGVLVTKCRLLVSAPIDANKTMDLISKLPSIPFSIWTKGEGELTFKVSQIDANRTKVSVSAKYRTYENNVTKSWYDCPSNGKNEAIILEELDKKILLIKDNYLNRNTVRPSDSETDDTLTKLERLAKLKQEGVLTEEEFVAQKRKILDV